LHTGLTPEIGGLVLDEKRASESKSALETSNDIGFGVAPIRLEDRFAEIDDSREEEKNAVHSLDDDWKSEEEEDEEI